MTWLRAMLVAALCVVAGGGCYKRADVGCTGSECPDAGLCRLPTVTNHVPAQGADAVDLLFVVDDSDSMRARGPWLRSQIMGLVRGLLSGDPDNDPSNNPGGVAPWPSVLSLRVGLVTSDLGTNGVIPLVDPSGESESLRGCGGSSERVHYGDDGVLRRALASRDPVSGVAVLDPITLDAIDCDADDDGVDDVLPASALPSFLTFEAASTGPIPAFLDHVACDTNVAADGCGFEQPLEAMLKAITPAAITPASGAFHAAPGEPNRARGHGDDPATNGSWFRPDALLAIVYVSDEDDCSARDPAVFDPASATYPDPHWADHPFAEVDTRCDRYSSLLHDPKRFVDGIRAARPDPWRVVFVAITGVPVDLVDEPFGNAAHVLEGTTNLDAILADPRMQRGDHAPSDPSDPSAPRDARVRFACVNDQDGDGRPALDADGKSSDFAHVGAADLVATPGIRAVEVARGLQTAGVPVFVGSICSSDLHEGTIAILTQIAHPLATACLPRAIDRDASGYVACTVVEELASGHRCAELASAGRTYLRTESRPDGDHEVCGVAQIALDAARAHDFEVHGWFYDDFSANASNCGSAHPQRISFTVGDDPNAGSSLTIECVKPGATCDGGGP